jgi:hypothetical protein
MSSKKPSMLLPIIINYLFKMPDFIIVGFLKVVKVLAKLFGVNPKALAPIDMLLGMKTSAPANWDGMKKMLGDGTPEQVAGIMKSMGG